MTAVWYTADLHIGHYMVAEMRARDLGLTIPNETQEDRREIIEWHNNFLAKNWDEVVDKRDSVWILGDLCLKGTGVTNRALEWISQRPGMKHLVVGNHDAVMPGINRDANKWQRRYLEVFESVWPYYRRKIAGQDVLLSHFPYQGSGDHTFEERFTQYRLPDLGEWLLHGHTHSAEKVRGKMIHVGLDAHGLKLVPQEWVEGVINGR